MLFVLDKINKNFELLLNIIFGMMIYDICWSLMIGVDCVKDIIKFIVLDVVKFVVGVVGLLMSDVMIVVVNFLWVFDIF